MLRSKHSATAGVRIGGRYSNDAATERQNTLRGGIEHMVWEYTIIALPRLEAPTSSRATSAAVRALNEEGANGWEAVGMTVLENNSIAVLLKREREGRSN